MSAQITPIYLDHNATTPLLPEVAEAIRACWSEPCLNPASQHELGRRARRRLEDARERIAVMLGASTSGGDHVVFTSGGTEANNLAIRGLTAPPSGAGWGGGEMPGHLIISRVEHPSILRLVHEMGRAGWRVDWLDVNRHGVIQAESISGLLRPDTRLVSAMLGQNETGVLQPIAQMSEICSRGDVSMHTDAAQVVGKLRVDFRALGAATMAVAAHKFHGPLGIGALVVRGDVELRPQLFGGFQQGGLRPGTESVALAVGMCRALEIWHAEQDERATRMRNLRDKFEDDILAGWPSAIVIGADADRLPHTSHIAFVGLDRQALFMALDRAGVACSTGSACASGSSEPSPVLIAMGCSEAVIGSALRFSLGATTTAAEVDEAARRILVCCNDLGRRQPC